jgi:tetratricopeptide (TPR) repeat protein
MSSTLPFSQRYMRALAHLPLLSMGNPERVLVIGFGVGNTTHAATLHPSIRRVEVADLSRGVLDHARYFSEFNKGVLGDPRVAVHVNDGRQHLQMQPPGSYDLVTLEPPPIAYAGVAALYSREFYELAKSRLKAGGYVSQWLPAYQVPSSTTLSMVRAFVDVFSGAVLVSGAESDLLLLGANGVRAEVDPGRLAASLARAPLARADLERIDLGRPTEIVGTFVASAATLADATRDTPPVTDDRPIQEYGVLSLLNFGEAVPASIVKLEDVASWCPRCFVDGRPVPQVADLELYLALLQRAYRASPVEVRRARAIADREGREVAGSAYLGAIVPESADLHNLLGIALASSGKVEEGIAEFRAALRLDPASAAAHWHLGAALASRGARAEALGHLQRSVELDPANAQAHNDLGLMLALQGRLDEAVGHFERAVALDPGFDGARNNLGAARRQLGAAAGAN